jgi:hypothetical protein
LTFYWRSTDNLELRFKALRRVKFLKHHRLVTNSISASVSSVLTLTSESGSMFNDNSINNSGNNYGVQNSPYGLVNRNPYSTPYYNSPYQPTLPWYPSWNPQPYRPRYPRYWPQPYSPPIQTIQVPQYIPIPYYSDPYMYDDDGDSGHCCNTVVSHHCHHDGERRRSRRGMMSSPIGMGYGGGLGPLSAIGWYDD